MPMKQTYWQRLPFTSLALFMAGVFFLLLSFGLAIFDQILNFSNFNFISDR